MKDVFAKAQEATARIAQNVVEGRVASSHDSQSRNGAHMDPVANGLENMTCQPDACGPDDIPRNPDRYQNEGIWPG